MKKLLVLLNLLLLPVVGYAYDFMVDGLCYDKNSDGATVTVTYEQLPLNASYSSLPDNLAIPSTVTDSDGRVYSVTSIGADAFNHCSGLTSVTIPNSVTSIGNSAFQGCSGLTSMKVASGNPIYDSRENCNAIIETATNTLISGCKSTVIPNSVTSIVGRAFAGCSGLTSVNIPNSVTSIGAGAFYGCSGLTSVNIPNSVTSIGTSAFSDCSGLTSVTIEDGPETLSFTIYDNFSTPFSGCPIQSLYLGRNLDYSTSFNYTPFNKNTKLTKLTIGNSVTSIGRAAFFGCSGLTSLTIPNSITSIGNYAFYGCSGLTSITIGNGVTEIGQNAFLDCPGLKDIHISDLGAWCNIQFGRDGSGNTRFNYSSNPLTYAQHLFLNDTDLTELSELVIPNSATTISSGAFFVLNRLTLVTIPTSVTSIGEYAFQNSSGLTSITIPNSVTSIGTQAFYNCRLETVLTKNATTAFFGAFSDRTYRHAMLYIPVGTWSDAVYVGGWYQFNNIRETAMTTDALFAKQAYSLVDGDTYEYTVYDPLNDDVASGKKFYNIDENNPDNAWQIIENAGKKYLYNIGANRYGVINANGNIELSVYAKPLDMEDTDDGIMLNKETGKKWLFVANNNVQTEDIPTQIPLINQDAKNSVIYDLTGRKTESLQHGVNLLRQSDGSFKKVFVK